MITGPNLKPENMIEKTNKMRMQSRRINNWLRIRSSQYAIIIRAIGNNASTK